MTSLGISATSRMAQTSQSWASVMLISGHPIGATTHWEKVRVRTHAPPGTSPELECRRRSAMGPWSQPHEDRCCLPFVRGNTLSLGRWGVSLHAPHPIKSIKPRWCALANGFSAVPRRPSPSSCSDSSYSLFLLAACSHSMLFFPLSLRNSMSLTSRCLFVGLLMSESSSIVEPSLTEVVVPEPYYQSTLRITICSSLPRYWASPSAAGVGNDGDFSLSARPARGDCGAYSGPN
jgi:hypothetical protein